MEEPPEERRKRQCREATAKYRAAHPEKVKVYAAAYLAANRDKMLRKGREAKARWREENLDESRARSAAWAAENRDAAKLRSAAWRAANPDRVLELAKRSRAKRKTVWAKFLAQERERYKKNPDKKLAAEAVRRVIKADSIAEYHRKWNKANAAKRRSYVSARRAAMMNAMPSWCDRSGIVALFDVARKLTEETGIHHEVDHIIPLRGKLVSGLHIPRNMRVVTRLENRRKFNKIVDLTAISQYEADRPRVSLPLSV